MKYKGVSKYGELYRAFISLQGKFRYIGTFKTAEEAARQYDRVAVLSKGVKAKTNFNLKEYL